MTPAIPISTNVTSATTTSVEQIAATVLYEGYLLWPYRRSARKNQQRWTFGGVYPRSHSEIHPDDPWRMQTQCLVTGAAPRVTVQVRFLQVVERKVARNGAGRIREFVDELQVGEESYLAWDEAAEREVLIDDVELLELAQPRTAMIDVDAGCEEEPLYDSGGACAGALVRNWQALEGSVTVLAQPIEKELYRLTVQIENVTPWRGEPREQTLRQTFVSTHTILRVTGGAFVSMTDPPPALEAAVEACENKKTWPVLAGAEEEAHTMLSSPIILYDYPQIAPESSGDLFDGTEIDQLLMLNILTLTDEEKAEMRATDPRARAILERTEALDSNSFMQLNGAIREFRTLRPKQVVGNDSELEIPPVFADLQRPAPEHVVVDGVEIRRGSRVKLRPRPGGDVMDLALDGEVGLIESIEQDMEDQIHIVVVLENDPGRDLGMARMPGHRFFFSLREVEPLEK